MSIGLAWNRYKSRKSRKGICLDFLFLSLIVLLCVPSLRRAALTECLRLTLQSPKPYDKILYLTPSDSILLLTALGADTLITFPPTKPTIFNIGDVWHIQTRAELKSLNALARSFHEQINVFHLSVCNIADAIDYTHSRHLSNIRCLQLNIPPDEAELMPTSKVGLNELASCLPATMVVDTDGRVVIKKVGAALWTSPKVVEIINSMVSEQTPPNP